MLREIQCDRFRSGTVVFSSGLNVVLGDENATNSIGKSTLLMIVDFAFGGETLLKHNKDIITELGHHDYYCIFQFADESYRFRRGTFEPNVVYVCNDELQPERAIDLDEYTALLKQAYRIDLPEITFRALLGLYFRVWGKENLAVDSPLHATPAQRARDCVDNLLKTFGSYESISALTKKLTGAESDLRAVTEAQRHDVLPKVSKRDYEQKQRLIATLERDLSEIKENLAKYSTSLTAVVNREVLELKMQKDDLLKIRMNLSSELQRIERNLQRNRGVRSEAFKELVRFFPEVNEVRLSKVEEFHNGVATILRKELRDAKDELVREIEESDAALSKIDQAMAAVLSSVDQPEALVDRVYDVSVGLYKAREAKESYEHLASLKGAVEALKEELSTEKVKVLHLVEHLVNDGMHRIVTEVFGENRKSPRLSLKERSYSFDVYEDTGTGTAYAGLVIFDLTVFMATTLPAIAHDSILFKNIENDSVARLMDVYMRTEKQSFVALDEISKYGLATAELLEARSVVHLSNEAVLYVKDWRRKT